MLQELDKFEKLAALPSPQEALADKYSAFDPVSGDPTRDAATGAALEGKALDKARKDMDKQRKVGGLQSVNRPRMLPTAAVCVASGPRYCVMGGRYGNP